MAFALRNLFLRPRAEEPLDQRLAQQMQVAPNQWTQEMIQEIQKNYFTVLQQKSDQAAELRMALIASEAVVADLRKAAQELRNSPHGAHFSEKASCIPGLRMLGAVLDANYRKSSELLSSRSFAAEPAMAASAVEVETLEHRKPVADPKDHAALMEALDPAEGSGLPSLQHLRAELGRQGEKTPEFFAAIGGKRLYETLGQILEGYTGPHRAEDKYLNGAVKVFVVDVIQRLYQSSKQAALDLQQRRDLEKEMTRGIADLSEELTQQFLETRRETEQRRSKKLQELMDFYLEKLRAVTDKRTEEVLGQSSQTFEQQNAKEVARYKREADQQEEHAAEQRRRGQALQVYCKAKQQDAKTATAVANWSRLAAGVRLQDEAVALKTHLDAVLGAVEDLRETSVMKDRADRELKHATQLAEAAGEEQERLAKEHEELAAHKRGCASLLSDFAAFVGQGYSGLRDKAEADATALVEDLPQDMPKVMALGRAYEEELDRQREVLTAVMRQTMEDRENADRQLRVLEMKRSRGSSEFQEVKMRYDEADDFLKSLTADMEFVNGLKAKCTEVRETYGKEFGRAGVACNSSFQGEAWAGKFLYNDREDNSFKPAARLLCYDGSEAREGSAAVQSLAIVRQSHAKTIHSSAAVEELEAVAKDGGAAGCCGDEHPSTWKFTAFDGKAVQTSTDASTSEGSTSYVHGALLSPAGTADFEVLDAVEAKEAVAVGAGAEQPQAAARAKQ